MLVFNSNFHLRLTCGARELEFPCLHCLHAIISPQSWLAPSLEPGRAASWRAPQREGDRQLNRIKTTTTSLIVTIVQLAREQSECLFYNLFPSDSVCPRVDLRHFNCNPIARRRTLAQCAQLTSLYEGRVFDSSFVAVARPTWGETAHCHKQL